MPTRPKRGNEGSGQRHPGSVAGFAGQEIPVGRTLRAVGLAVSFPHHLPGSSGAVRDAARRCNLEGLTPHYLRHAYASHALQGGAFVRDLQVVLGHNHLETTMLYLHTEAGRVASPLVDYVSAPNPRMAPERKSVVGVVDSACLQPG